MNNFQIQSFVRQLIAEAKKAKDVKEPKDTKDKAKKDTKKPEPKKAKKASGNLVEMKEDLAKLKEKSSKIDDLIGEWGQMKSAAENMSYGGEQDVEIGADLRDSIIEDCDKEIEKLKKEKESIDKEIADLKENTANEINKIKEMMGLASEKKEKEKMMDEKKMTSAQKSKKEDIVKGMKKSGGFGKSKEEKSKMYATATKLATKK
jgi:hypothetical protein